MLNEPYLMIQKQFSMELQTVWSGPEAPSS